MRWDLNTFWFQLSQENGISTYYMTLQHLAKMYYPAMEVSNYGNAPGGLKMAATRFHTDKFFIESETTGTVLELRHYFYNEEHHLFKFLCKDVEKYPVLEHWYVNFYL